LVFSLVLDFFSDGEDEDSVEVFHKGAVAEALLEVEVSFSFDAFLVKYLEGSFTFWIVSVEVMANVGLSEL